MKEISLEKILQKMHQNDFVEKEVINVNGFLENMVDISTDDKGIISKAFLKTEESTMKSGDHYIVPLPFKKENLIMPNNRKQAMQRLFGGVSSASCPNYALNGTATDNTNQYGQEAAEVTRSKFYVDDLLKSVDDTKTAMILVKKVVDMCKSGGFHLTKFISNNTELLMSIPENQRRNSVKNADLIEKALDIQ